MVLNYIIGTEEALIINVDENSIRLTKGDRILWEKELKKNSIVGNTWGNMSVIVSNQKYYSSFPVYAFVHKSVWQLDKLILHKLTRSLVELIIT